MAKTHKILRGSCPLVLTPFKDNEDLDLDGLKAPHRLAHRQGRSRPLPGGELGRVLAAQRRRAPPGLRDRAEARGGPGAGVRRHLRARPDDARERRVRAGGGRGGRRRPDGQAVPLHRRVGAAREGPRGGHPRGAPRVLRRDVAGGQHPDHALQLGVGDGGGEPRGAARADRARVHPVRQGVHRHRDHAADDRPGRRPAVRLQRHGGLGVPRRSSSARPAGAAAPRRSSRSSASSCSTWSRRAGSRRRGTSGSASSR